VYAWHCDAVGGYSLYDAVADQNYLRGVQAADRNGDLGFLTVFPGAYPGRWPHVHFEVYRTLDEATGGGTPIATSQLALPQDACEEVFADGSYGDSAAHLAATPIDSDLIFSDGYDSQMAAVSGAPSNGLTATLTIPV
jgi:protocatechuate 3,4-dioxygenase beta subunit